MKILATGETGQLVCSLAERARFHGDLDFVAIGRPRLDLERPFAEIKAVIEAEQPDVVVNCAAYTLVDQAEDESRLAFRINAEGAGAVASAAADLGASIIQISTDYVFDGSRDGPYDENVPTCPLGVYGKSKLAGEEAVRGSNPRHAIVRTAWVYSPFGRNFVKSIMAAAGVRPELSVVCDQVGSPTSALDLADGIFALIRAGALSGETFHVAGTGTASWFDFAVRIIDECRRLGMPWVPVKAISTQAWPTRAVRPRNSVLNCDRFSRRVGFEMPDWTVSVTNVVQRLGSSRGDLKAHSVNCPAHANGADPKARPKGLPI